MKIIIYTQKDNTHKDDLFKKVSQVTDLTPVMVFDFEGLLSAMRSKIYGKVIIVFLISFERELELLISNRKWLSNTRHIIILPNNEKTLVSKALSLYPRYLSQSSHGFKDVCAVLNKMIEYNAKKEKQIRNAHQKIN